MWTLYINDKKVTTSDNRNICVDNLFIYKSTGIVDPNRQTIEGYFWNEEKQKYTVQSVSYCIIQEE